ncbi:hypothetical protein [Sorangium sp. So ce362]|uniref:hypothetical protein n=1 Tax=Sorangium sp. So ce362 TaxID=3133303 RepID=UPI003F5FA87A
MDNQDVLTVARGEFLTSRCALAMSLPRGRDATIAQATAEVASARQVLANKLCRLRYLLGMDDLASDKDSTASEGPCESRPLTAGSQSGTVYEVRESVPPIEGSAT